MLRSRLVIVLVALGIVAAACGSREPRSVEAGVGPAATAAASGDAATLQPGSGAITPRAGEVATDAGPQAPSGPGTPGDSSANDTAEPQGAAGAAGAECPGERGGDPIPIGGSFPLSGPVGFLGKQQLAAMDTFAEMWNARGGICGRKLRLIALDDGMDPSRQLANIRKLNEQENVLLAATILTVGIGDYVTRNGLPILALGGAMEPFSPEQPTVFAALGSAVHFTGAFIEGWKRAGIVKEGMRIGLLYDTEIFNLAPVKDDLADQWKRAGMEVVSLDAFNLSDGDCTSLLLKVRQAQIEFWDFQGFGWTLCVAAAERQGWRPPAGWGGWTTSAAGIPELAGPSADGVWFGGTDQHSDEYAREMQKYHPEQVRHEADLHAPPSIGAWMLLKAFEGAVLRHGGEVGRDQVIEYFQQLKELAAVDGRPPAPVNFSPDCKSGVTPAPNTGFKVGQWEYNAETKRFDRSFVPNEIQENPFMRPCEAARLAAEKY